MEFNTHDGKLFGRLDFPMEYFYVDASHPGYVTKPHWHKEWELIRVVSGSLDISIDFKVLNGTETDFFLISEGFVHNIMPKNCVYESIVFDPRGFFHSQPLMRKHLQPNYNQSRRMPFMLEDTDLAGKSILNLLFDHMRQQGVHNEMFVFGLLCMFVGHIDKENLWEIRPQSSSSTRKLQTMKQLVDFIEDNYKEELTLDDLALQAGMSSRYFCRFFKDMTQRTPFEYLNMYRIQMACLELLTTNHSITSIALNNGFRDLNYFIRTFKQYKGVTPTQFMNQNALKESVKLEKAQDPGIYEGNA